MRNLKDMEYYYFDRDFFVSEMRAIKPDIEDLFDLYNEDRVWKMWNFIMFRLDHEFYILHLDSGTMINWYKNLGRTNTCNKSISVDEFREFIRMLREDISQHIRFNPDRYERYLNVINDKKGGQANEKDES